MSTTKSRATPTPRPRPAPAAERSQSTWRCCGPSTSADAASARTRCATRSHAPAATTCGRSSRPATSCSRRRAGEVDAIVAGACRPAAAGARRRAGGHGAERRRDRAAAAARARSRARPRRRSSSATSCFLPARRSCGRGCRSCCRRRNSISCTCRRRECWVVSRRKPNGWYGFPGDFVERAVGVAGTARNWSTVTKLAALLGVQRGPASARPWAA